MPTFTDDFSAIRALKTRLATVFGTGGTYEADFTSFGGVDVQMKTDEDDEPENVGKPLIVLEQDAAGSGTSQFSSARSEYRDVVVMATTYVSDFSGAQQGTANPTTSDELLSKDLVKEIEGNYAAFRDLGLEGIEIIPQRMVKDAATGVRRIPHRISFSYSRN